MGILSNLVGLLIVVSSLGLEAAGIGGTSNDLSPLPGKANPDNHHSRTLRTFRTERPNGGNRNKHGINGRETYVLCSETEKYR